jgi:protocatechuate 3,4-dioxygenase, alpha subunit
MSLRASTSQTIGPYLRIGLEWMVIEDLAPKGLAGERLTLQGRIVDGDGKPVNDAAVELWQADSNGKYDSAFRGFGRSLTDERGNFRFRTIKPGRVPGPHGRLQAPHLVVTIFMRGLLKQLLTRVYFPGEPANAEDPVLGLIPAARRGTLVAARKGDAVLEWSVVLQGANETVFFDF